MKYEQLREKAVLWCNEQTEIIPLIMPYGIVLDAVLKISKIVQEIDSILEIEPIDMDRAKERKTDLMLCMKAIKEKNHDISVFGYSMK